MKKIKIIYLHGFRSSSQSNKVNQLQEAFPECEVVSLTLSPRPVSAINQIRAAISTDIKNTIVVGTSLGGFYAIYCACFLGTPAFIINPALEPHVSLVTKVGSHTRYGTGEPYEFKESYIDELDMLFKRIQSSSKPANLLHFYLSEDDELINFNALDKYFPERKLTKWFKSAGHRFTAFTEIFPDIKKVLNSFKS